MNIDRAVQPAARTASAALGLCAAMLLGACGEHAEPTTPVAKTDVGAAQIDVAHQSATLPFAVGSQTRFIHDHSRGYDTVAGVNEGVRTLITELWYPVAPAAVSGEEYAQATYGDYVFGNRAMHKRMMTETTFFHLTPDTVRDGVSQHEIDAAIDELFDRPRNSFVDAPLAPSLSKLPIVVMTHGDAGSRYNMGSACEHLAAHGYLVIAPEHTGNSPYSMTGADPALAIGVDPDFAARMSPVLALLDEHGAYGSAETYGQSYTPLVSGDDQMRALKQLDASLIQRLNDLRATLTELERMNASGPFAGRLDLQRIGLMGRSFGGASTLVGLQFEPRIRSGMAVVPPGWSDVRASLPAELLAPAGQESVLFAADGEFALAHISKPTLLLSGAEDDLIIGLQAGGEVAPSSDNPHPLMRAAFLQTDALAVWGLLADSNHGSFGVSGPYWWPHLKSQTRTRYFAPERTFTLVSPALAHQIQRDKALAFFDLTLREQADAVQRLMDPGYAAAGLTLEGRNLPQ